MVDALRRVKSLSKDKILHDVIIKKDHYLCEESINAQLSYAQKKSEDMMNKARQAFSEHQREGYQDGLNAAKNDMAECQLKAYREVNQMIQSAETELLGLLTVMIKKLFDEAEDEHLLAGMVRTALATVRDQYRVSIRINSAVKEKIHSALFDGVDQRAIAEHIELVVDSSLSGDECVVETDTGIIQCSLSDQLERLQRLILNLPPSATPQRLAQSDLMGLAH